MATYVLMTKLGADLKAQLGDRAEIGREWLELVKTKCPDVKFLSHYALFGPYDFMDIYEAPDEETAAKVSMISLANGAHTAESWVAIPYQRLLELARDL